MQMTTNISLQISCLEKFHFKRFTVHMLSQISSDLQHAEQLNYSTQFVRILSHYVPLAKLFQNEGSYDEKSLHSAVDLS